jgi:hypothetical protein
LILSGEARIGIAQGAMHDHHIDPAAEFQTDAAKDAFLPKS